jgi:single-strand DNA-binding protein
MSDMNLCIFEGNLTRDPELSQAGETNVVRFTIASNTKRGKGKERTAFVNCEAWDKGADLIAKHFKRGKPIRVFAECLTDKYEKDGKTVYTTKFRVNEFFFVSRGAGADQTEGGEEAPSTPTPKSAAPKASTTKTTRKATPKPPEPEDDGNGDDQGDEEIPF